jgi:hypothetical protein
MKHRIRMKVGALTGRLSSAHVIAFAALFVALGGSAYALAEGSVGSRELEDDGVRSIDLRNDDVRGTDIEQDAVHGSDVANNELGGVDVANNGLSGDDIDESSLGQVPDADRVDGIDAVGFRFVENAGTPPREVFRLGDLSMEADCNQIAAVASMNTSVVSHNDNASLSAATPNGGTTDIENDLDDGDVEVLSGDAYNDGNGPNTLVYVSPSAAFNGGDVVTVQWMADEEDGLAGRDCVLAGIAFQRDFPAGINPPPPR